MRKKRLMMTGLTVRDLAPVLEGARSRLRPQPPLRLSEWAEQNFYLSPEQSHNEEPWRSFPYQVGILDCMGDDEIEEVSFRKSARVGYTKMLLATIGYFAAHKARKQAIWNPTDTDSDQFVINELDPMIRDVKAVRDVFPDFGRRTKHNTLKQKSFIGAPLYTKGGASSTNFRRTTLDVSIIDEADGFEVDLKSLGSPYKRAKKRTEGATFPKVIVGSTPGLRGASVVDAREAAADMRVSFRFPCPCCSERIDLRFGGKKEPFGFKWHGGDPETVKHLCEKCGGLFSQDEYLGAWQNGRWQSSAGDYLGPDGLFYDAEGVRRDAPRSIAFYVWTAYSPQTSWSDIVREWLSASRTAERGDLNELKAFVTETLGESWEIGGDATTSEELKKRAEKYELETVPAGACLLTMAADVQKDRIEYLIKAWGSMMESWQVGYGVLWGDPSETAVWSKLRAVIVCPLVHENGHEMRPVRVFVDSGGAHTHEVYQFCRDNQGIGVFAVKGHAQRERPIVGTKPSKVDINRKGEVIKSGASLWLIGVHAAKNLIFNRLMLKHPGPGYVHFSDDLPDEYYEQLTVEKRVPRFVNGHEILEWKKPAGAANEAWDLEVYALAAAYQYGIHRWKQRKWDLLLQRFAPKPSIPKEIEPEIAQAVVQERARSIKPRRRGWVKGW